VLDGEHVPCAALVQVGGVLALAVQRVGGDHQPAWVDAGGGQLVDQRGEPGDVGSTTRRGARLLWGSFSAWSPPEPAVRVSP
jgi:hypothetical protein